MGSFDIEYYAKAIVNFVSRRKAFSSIAQVVSLTYLRRPAYPADL